MLTTEDFYAYDEFCQNCAADRAEEGKSPHIKLRLRQKTERKGLNITVCPECDGPTLDFALRNSEG